MQPKIYTYDQHLISPKHIEAHAFYIIEKLKSKGFKAYLVGGGVRDLLLKQVPKDFDISTSAKPQEIKQIFKNCILIGKRFRLAHIRFGHKIFEVSTFRSGDISSSELILRDNEWGNEEEDVLRRDFTINGLLYDTANQTIIDYVGGVEDAKERILRAIGDPKIRFIQDPVRMIRLLKFKARFNFDIKKNTLEALKECKNEIVKSSQARILEELFRMLISGASEAFFKLLQTYGLLQYLLIEVSNHLNKSHEIYNLLKQADIYICKHDNDILERSVLVSCLLFPILEQKLKETEPVKLHLGIIADAAKELVNQVFHPFFHLSRKIKAMIISILINQFRFTPLFSTLKKSRIRIPKDPFFHLSLKFFKLRSMHNTNLLQTYSLWHEHLISSHHQIKKNHSKRPCKKTNI